jgi:hypothetical protein
MIAYHIDRANSLTSGQVMQLEKMLSNDVRLLEYMNTMFPQGVSFAGKAYVSNLEFTEDKDYYQRIKEIEFEYIRRLYFPQKPSRFQSFFAIEEQDIYAWIKTLHLEKDENLYTIWKLNIDNDVNVSKHDASWRDIYYHVKDEQDRPIFSAYQYHMDGIEYWRGKSLPNPLPELLVPLINCKVTILEPINRQ